jgi:hypothetical protein
VTVVCQVTWYAWPSFVVATASIVHVPGVSVGLAAKCPAENR